MGSYKIISADDHVFEPADLYTSRMEGKYRDRAPRVERIDGGDFWVCEGLNPGQHDTGEPDGGQIGRPQKAAP